MNKLIFVLAMMIGISGAVNAQTTISPQTSMEQMKMKDGVRMVDNKAMLFSKSKCTPLTKT